MSEALTPESKEVLEFIRCGRAFCELYDRVPPGEDMKWVKGIYLALTELHRAAFVLNLGMLADIGDEPQLPSTSAGEYLNDVSRLSMPFGVFDGYALVWDLWKFDESNSVVCGSIADDLYDIQCDIRAGLDRWENAGERERLHWIWDWRFSFKSHWWRHAHFAMRALLEFILEKDSGFGQ